MKTQKKTAYLQMLMGYIVIGTGGAMFVYCNFGADAFNAVAKGLSPIVGVGAGTAGLLIQAFF